MRFVDRAGAELARSDCLEAELITCSLSKPSRSEVSSARTSGDIASVAGAVAATSASADRRRDGGRGGLAARNSTQSLSLRCGKP